MTEPTTDRNEDEAAISQPGPVAEQVDTFGMRSARPRDAVLEALHRRAEIDGLALGITLIVGGTVISGTLCKAKFFLSPIIEPWKDLPEDTVGGTLSKEVGQTLSLYEERVLTGDEFPFIHLADAQIYVPGQPPMPQTPAAMRVDAYSVEGWLYGTLAVSK